MDLERMEALLPTRCSKRACALVISFFVGMLSSPALALPEPKVTIEYSLEVLDGGSYWQKISNTPGGLGDVDYVYDVADSGDPNVTVFVDNPLLVTLEFTADAPGGNIVDGPVELTDIHFEREFEIDSSGLTLIHTTIHTVLARKGSGTLSGSTITWENAIAPYQETVVGSSTCTGFGCAFVSDPFPRDLSGTFDVPLPAFTVFTVDSFGDAFSSDNGTPNDPSDDINRPDADATVKDTWNGVALLPEPGEDLLLLAGIVGLVGLHRLREPGGATA